VDSHLHPLTARHRQYYRAIGGQLAVYLRQRGHDLPSAQTLQALASDFAAGHDDLVLPLKDLLLKPAFRQLIPKAGSGKGTLERQALLQSMQNTFAPAVIDALGDVLSGFLDLPKDSTSEAAIPANNPDSIPNTQPRLFSQENQRQSTSQTSNSPSSHSESSAPAKRTSGRTLAIALLGAGTCVLGLGLIAVTPVTPLCQPLKICLGQQNNGNDIFSILESGSLAQNSLEQATDLETYQSAASRLDAALSKLNSLELSPYQHFIQQKLQNVSTRARDAIAQEKLDQERLLRVQQAIESAKNLSVEGREAQLDAARRDLEPIASSRFAASRARELRQQLDSLLAESPEAPSSTPADAPTPDSYTPRPSTPSSSTPWRRQPLW